MGENVQETATHPVQNHQESELWWGEEASGDPLRGPPVKGNDARPQLPSCTLLFLPTNHSGHGEIEVICILIASLHDPFLSGSPASYASLLSLSYHLPQSQFLVCFPFSPFSFQLASYRNTT